MGPGTFKVYLHCKRSQTVKSLGELLCPISMIYPSNRSDLCCQSIRSDPPLDPLHFPLDSLTPTSQSPLDLLCCKAVHLDSPVGIRRGSDAMIVIQADGT